MSIAADIKTVEEMEGKLSAALNALRTNPTPANVRYFKEVLRAWQRQDWVASRTITLLEEIRDLQAGLVPNNKMFTHTEASLANGAAAYEELTAGMPGWGWEKRYTAHVFRVKIYIWTAAAGSAFNTTWDAREVLELGAGGEERWVHEVRKTPWYLAFSTRWDLTYTVDIFPPVRFESTEAIRSTWRNDSGGTLSCLADWYFFTVSE